MCACVVVCVSRRAAKRLQNAARARANAKRLPRTLYWQSCRKKDIAQSRNFGIEPRKLQSTPPERAPGRTRAVQQRRVFAVGASALASPRTNHWSSMIIDMARTHYSALHETFRPNAPAQRATVQRQWNNNEKHRSKTKATKGIVRTAIASNTTAGCLTFTL